MAHDSPSGKLKRLREEFNRTWNDSEELLPKSFNRLCRVGWDQEPSGGVDNNYLFIDQRRYLGLGIRVEVTYWGNHMEILNHRFIPWQMPVA